ncbi:MAG: zinc ribbon domain-containing protein [Pyrinomonadaceae bacterium]|jgi:putative FmdB family regulatory protein|nr:zinc ribbon domain-containing protein [Pyrinomonadaceae bacterium]
MPIYEYACRKCAAHTEAFQKVSDKPLTKCLSCGGRLEKQWSQTSFQLKGSGWYVTDYAAKKTGAAEAKTEDGKKESAETTPAVSKGETKAENKSATPEKSSTPKPTTTTVTKTNSTGKD